MKKMKTCKIPLERAEDTQGQRDPFSSSKYQELRKLWWLLVTSCCYDKILDRKQLRSSFRPIVQGYTVHCCGKAGCGVSRAVGVGAGASGRVP